jgi:hypothetical protein
MDLQTQINELKKKVDELYSVTGFPEPVLLALQQKGFVRISKTLQTPFTTTDNYDSKYYYMFSKIDNKDVVFSNLNAKDFNVIQNINTSTNVFTITNNGFANGDAFVFWTTDTPPSPIDNGNTYYTRDVTTDTFKLTDTPGGVALDITDKGVGIHYLQRINIIP